MLHNHLALVPLLLQVNLNHLQPLNLQARQEVHQHLCLHQQAVQPHLVLVAQPHLPLRKALPQVSLPAHPLVLPQVRVQALRKVPAPVHQVALAEALLALHPRVRAVHKVRLHHSLPQLPRVPPLVVQEVLRPLEVRVLLPPHQQAFHQARRYQQVVQVSLLLRQLRKVPAHHNRLPLRVLLLLQPHLVLVVAHQHQRVRVRALVHRPQQVKVPQVPDQLVVQLPVLYPQVRVLRDHKVPLLPHHHQ